MSNAHSGRFLHLSRFMISIGVFLLTMVIFGVLGAKALDLLYDMDVTALLAKEAADFTHDELVALKVFQSISAMSFIVAAFISVKVFNQSFLEFTRLSAKPKALHLGLVVLYIVAMLPLIAFLLIWNQGLELPDELAKQFRDLEAKSDRLYQIFLDLNTGKYLIFNLFMMALLPALGEELFFRGLLQRIFIDWSKNAHWGIILTSVVFALLHAQLFKVVPMIFLAVTMGYLFYYSGSIWVPILFHFINNSMVVIASRLQDAGLDYPILEDTFEFPAYVTVAAALLYIVLHYIHRKTRVEYVSK